MDTLALAAEGTLVDPKVLLIEPDAATIRAFVGGLEQAGMQVICAKDGETGLALRARLLPEILLVGLRLPDMNSVSLVGRLIEPRNSGVIVLSANEDEAARIACLELGADDYLAKPPSVRDMVARVRSVHRRVNVRNAPAARHTAEASLVIGRSGSTFCIAASTPLMDAG